MSDRAQGPGWWQASDGRWYPPESHPDVRLPPAPVGAAHEPGPALPDRRSIVVLSLGGTLVAVLVIVAVVVALLPTAASRHTVATFVPVSPSASTRQLG